MTEYMPALLILAGAAASWYCYRWGRDDGYAEGYEDGRQKGLLEGADVVVTPTAAGGPGGVPR